MILDADLKFFDNKTLTSYTSPGNATDTTSDIVDLGGLPPVNSQSGAVGVSGLGLDAKHAKLVVKLSSELLSGGSIVLKGASALSSGALSSAVTLGTFAAVDSGNTIFELPFSAFEHASFRFLQVTISSKNTSTTTADGFIVLATPHNSGAVI